MGFNYEGVNLFNTNPNAPDTTEEEKQMAILKSFKPSQHPIHLNSEDTHIVSYKVPPKNLTPYYEVPD